MLKKTHTRAPHLSDKSFWGIKKPSGEKSFREKSEYIITNVFNHGTFDDMIALCVYYGNKKIKATLRKASNLTRSTVLLAASMFALKPKDFKCYTNRRYSPL